MEAGKTARHIKMLNEERERQEKNVSNSGGRGHLSGGHVSSNMEAVVRNSRHRPVQRVVDTSTSVRQKLPNSPANSRQQMTFSDIDDVCIVLKLFFVFTE